uniref:Uncharacterized protein n=1 Tax=Arundo donax TaxID=35708 RepID=A0A0A9EDR7_ARUDO
MVLPNQNENKVRGNCSVVCIKITLSVISSFIFLVCFLL